jgi:glycosyltransferase involved in cell wall biosynthesis
LEDARLGACEAILVQYERSLVPGGDFLARLSARHPGKVYVVPHEVYGEDPFAFPYGDLHSAFPPWLWLKRLRYRWRHPEYAREKRLQAAGYAARGVIPLSAPGAAILRPLAGAKVLDPVPHAFFAPPENPAARPRREDFFSPAPRAVLGIFGFLNPGLDYAMVLDALARLDAGTVLLILGGARDGGSVGDWLRREAGSRGMSGRVKATGYLPEADLAAHLRLCDVFICPMKFKSNSGSLLHLLHLGKPILAADLPLTRWLREEGAPLELFSGPEELGAKIKAALDGAYARPNRYRWDFAAVAEAYLSLIRSSHY